MGRRFVRPLLEMTWPEELPRGCATCPPRLSRRRAWFVWPRDVDRFYPLRVVRVQPPCLEQAFSMQVCMGA
jgi:hypothetical protein